MKKFLYAILAFLLVFTLVGCGNNSDELGPKIEGALTYSEYMAKEDGTDVTVVAYVQAKQSWWDNKATVYAEDLDGGYFFYNMACTEEQYAKLVPGTRIKVSGTKSTWAGEVEVVDATFEIVEGKFIASATDVTSVLGTDALINHQNKFVSFKGLTVEASTDAEGKKVAYLYKHNGAGEEGDDLYFNVSLNGKTYTFTVESYLCDKDSDVYKAVKNLKVGDVIDMEGFLYWYEGVNPHITKVEVTSVANKLGSKVEGALTYSEYMAKEDGTDVTVVAYVQAKQSWWDNKATVYAEDLDGGYFFYNMACTEEQYAKLVPGTRIKVSGTKSTWAGEVEVVDATFEIVEGFYIAPVTEVTSVLGTDALINYQNQFVSFKGLKVEASTDPDGNTVAYLYKWNGAGEEGDDLYFNVSLNGKTYTFTVESYLCDKDSDVYKAVKNLKVGDVIDMEGFLYWYEGVNPHITKVVVK